MVEYSGGDFNEEIKYILAAHRNAVESIPVGRFGPIQKNRMELAEFLRAVAEIVTPSCVPPTYVSGPQCQTTRYEDVYPPPRFDDGVNRQTIIRNKLHLLADELDSPTPTLY